MTRSFVRKGFCILLFSAAISIGAIAQDRAVVKRTAPAYPEMARRMHVAGKVVVKVTIAPDGRVKSASAVSGHPLLTQAAVSAVRNWVYSAGPEETKNVEISFSM